MNADAIKSKFANLMNQSPNKLTATIPGTTDPVTAVKTSLDRDIKYSEFGKASGYKFSIIVELADLTDKEPEIDSLVSIDGTEYRIMDTDTDSTDVSIRVDLGQKYA